MNAVGAIGAESQTTVPQPRLVQAAHEFEAQLMKELLTPITDGNGLDGEDADPGSAGALMSFDTEALGEALSKNGGLGIATNIIHKLSRNEGDSQFISTKEPKEEISTNRGGPGSSILCDCR